ncbi:hypothetical protein O9G_000070 [Rozella allomycis CSF55]|uniref:Uncharacterized protein n=1 Tax=Rozella allomycis (strain CSF55) TaxID=988480 RepID=A0A075ASC5_ROZAC|nr:hypothetical protein O9G_000070 [Rozella allomycis CSF55]|eukprot:EPZ31591.1 hypothetical protein O9G_000070 [Rozella allomycis CSF55]
MSASVDLPVGYDLNKSGKRAGISVWAYDSDEFSKSAKEFNFEVIFAVVEPEEETIVAEGCKTDQSATNGEVLLFFAKSRNVSIN